MVDSCISSSASFPARAHLHIPIVFGPSSLCVPNRFQSTFLCLDGYIHLEIMTHGSSSRSHGSHSHGSRSKAKKSKSPTYTKHLWFCVSLDPHPEPWERKIQEAETWIVRLPCAEQRLEPYLHRV